MKIPTCNCLASTSKEACDGGLGLVGLVVVHSGIAGYKVQLLGLVVNGTH